MLLYCMTISIYVLGHWQSCKIKLGWYDCNNNNNNDTNNKYHKIEMCYETSSSIQELPASSFTCLSLPGFHWMMRQAGSFCGPVWTMSWCAASHWPCWPKTVAGRRRLGGSVSMCWTSTTMHRCSRRRRTWAHWERMSKLSSRWHESGCVQNTHVWDQDRNIPNGIVNSSINSSKNSYLLLI